MRSLSAAALAALLPLACTAFPSRSLLTTTSDWSARSISLNHLVPAQEIQKRQSWTLTQPGTTGVLAMQMVVISETQLLIIDRVSNNSMQIDGHSAWASVYSTVTNTARPVRLTTNSFCAGGSFLSNGTLVNIGGFTAEIAEVPDQNGLQAIRHFEPSSCPDTPGAPNCQFYENVSRIRLATPRWYPTIVKLNDGSTLIIGGAKAAPFMNNATINVASVEHYPPKSFGYSDGMPLPMQFLADTLNANLFPLAFLLPNTKVFLVSNNRAAIYDWRINRVENIVPPLPNGVRVSYPMTGSGTILPLEQAPDGSWTATILVCGGTTRSDTVPPSAMSSQDAASSQCASIVYSPAGLAAGWTVENMPEARIMPDMVLLPDGRVLIVNGAQTGYAGYGNVNQQVGASNADHPTLKPLIYDPKLPVGQRFSSAGLPTSSIPRMYHSVASLLPSGAVAITGSNPNGKAVSGLTYPTEYRMEILSPPYMSMVRPVVTGCPKKAGLGALVSFNLTVPPGTQTIRAAILDLGFSTHSLHMNMRHVWLESFWSNNNQTYNVRMPPSGGTIFPPGPGWLYILADGVASQGQSILVGNGVQPPVVQAFIDNMLNKTANPQG